MVVILPIEIINRIFLYLSSPTSVLIKKTYEGKTGLYRFLKDRSRYTNTCAYSIRLDYYSFYYGSKMITEDMLEYYDKRYPKPTRVIIGDCRFRYKDLVF